MRTPHSPRAILSARLLTMLECDPSMSRRGRCGVEHEFSILRGATPVDFGSLIDQLDVDGRKLDPSDPNARRLAWGGVLTVDGREAEVVTPPVVLEPGGSERAVRLAGYGRRELARALVAHDPQLAAVGYSTHLNVSAPDRLTMRAARLFVGHFSPSLMLLIERPHSPGLLVRPRRNRLEVAGEYVASSQLEAALTFFAGAAHAATRAAAHRTLRRRLPPATRPCVRPSDTRFGWYVARGAFGPDLSREGRAALLPVGRRRRRAGDLLCESWEAIRDETATFAGASSIATVDDIVAGRRPLPLECPEGDAECGPVASLHGAVIRARERRGFTVDARVATWDATLFDVRSHDERSTCVVNVPDAYLARFQQLLQRGELDDVLLRALREAPTGAVLRTEAETGEPGIYDSVADPTLFTPAERDVATGRIGGGNGRDAREQKNRQGEQPRRRVSRVLIAAAAVVAAVIIAAIVFAATRSGSRAHASAVAAPSSTVAATTTPPLATLASEISGTYAVDDSALTLTTVYRRGLFSSITPFIDGATITYNSPDSRPAPRVSRPSGDVTYTCTPALCRAAGRSPSEFALGAFSLSPSGAYAPFGAIQEVSRCGAPGPPDAGGSGGRTPITVTHDSSGRVTEIDFLQLYGFARSTTATTSDGCANVVLATLHVVLRRVG